MDDTNEAAEERYFELLRQRSPMERLQMTVSLTRGLRDLVIASIVRDEPNATTTEVSARLTERLYGNETARRLFPQTLSASS